MANGGGLAVRQVITPVALRRALHDCNREEFRMGRARTLLLQSALLESDKKLAFDSKLGTYRPLVRTAKKQLSGGAISLAVPCYEQVS